MSRATPDWCTGVHLPPLPQPTPAAEVEDEDEDEDDKVEEGEVKDGDNDEDEDEDEDEENSPPLLLASFASFFILLAFFRSAKCSSSVSNEELLLAILGLAMQLLK